MNQDRDFSPLMWRDRALFLIDQLSLPGKEEWRRYQSADEVHEAIRTMVVRGAPAIGCAAAYGVALAALRVAEEQPDAGAADVLARLEQAIEHLATSRPTAVNLFWALERMRTAAKRVAAESSTAAESNTAAVIADALEQEARDIHVDDIERCRRIGQFGETLVPAEATVLTHCNAGALATGGYGTALGVIRAASEAGKRIRVLADETRPYLQGARLTAWELARDNIDVTVIPDVAAAALIRHGEVQCCVVGADRIAANGDVANKIGTYGVALAAQANGVPFYVAAPLSTVDLDTATGADIPIEQRSGDEVLEIAGHAIAPDGAKARYPAFDITPAALVTAIITDRGVVHPPYGEGLLALSKSETGK